MRCLSLKGFFNEAEVSLNGQLHQREQYHGDLILLFTSAMMNRHRLTADICSRVTKG